MAKLDEIKEQIGFVMNEIMMYLIVGAFLFFIVQFAILSKKLIDSE